jgi:(p)ppGpp synthase/HD superfamily hydrolase
VAKGLLPFIARARELAQRFHREQKYGDEPYIVHLRAVEAVLVEFGFLDEEMRSAAYLHDVLEDTSATSEDLLREGFSKEVVGLVEGVTSESGSNRRERNSATYPKIAQDVKRVALKLADRIANVRHSIATNSSHLEIYKREHPGFRRALHGLFDESRINAMWRSLDALLG